MRVLLREPDPDGSAELPGEDVLHVWQFRLDAAGTGCDALLTADERERAARYRLDRVREQFVACRGMLRTILGFYLGCPAREVPLRQEAGGKPVLAQPAVAGLHFNLTHSAGVGLLAVGMRPVGIDVERLRDVPNAAGLVGRFFAAAEREEFARLPADLRTAGFFRGWTCKEALLKAVGRGLQDLESCVVVLDPRVEPRVVRFDPGPWHLAAWEPLPGYAAALAVESAALLAFG
jgi:4'-phosphopantetheinyl transferase